VKNHSESIQSHLKSTLSTCVINCRVPFVNTFIEIQSMKHGFKSNLYHRFNSHLHLHRQHSHCHLHLLPPNCNRNSHNPLPASSPESKPSSWSSSREAISVDWIRKHSYKCCIFYSAFTIRNLPYHTYFHPTSCCKCGVVLFPFNRSFYKQTRLILFVTLDRLIYILHLNHNNVCKLCVVAITYKLKIYIIDMFNNLCSIIEFENVMNECSTVKSCCYIYYKYIHTLCW